MLAHVSRSFWSIPHNVGVGLCQLAQQSRADVIQPSSLFARRTVKPTNVPTPSTDVRNDNGILCSKKKHVSRHFLYMLGKCEENVFLFRNMSLTLLNNEAILYIGDARVRHTSLRGSSNAVPARSSRVRNTQYKDKPDMIEVDTTYSWQMPCGVDAGDFCASVPASLSRTQSEFGLACVNEVSASKQADTARLQLTLRRPVVSRNRQESATFPLTNSFPSPASGTLHRALISGLRTVNSTFMPTWVSPYPCRLFLFSVNTIQTQGSL